MSINQRGFQMSYFNATWTPNELNHDIHSREKGTGKAGNRKCNSKRLRVLNRDRRQETRAVNNFTSAFEKYFTRRYPATTSNDSASFESNEIVEIKRGAVHAGSTHLPRIQLCWIA